MHYCVKYLLHRLNCMLILMLLYIVLAYFIRFNALLNAVCSHNALFCLGFCNIIIYALFVFMNDL